MRAISFSTVLIYTTGLGIYASGFGRFDPADHGASGFRKKHYFSASECQDNRRNLSCRFVNPDFSAYFHAFCGSFQCRYRRHCSDACSADLRTLAVIDQKRPLTIREGICFVLAASGVFLIVTKGNFTSLDFSFEGVLWGLASAVFSAAYSIQPRKLIIKVGEGPVVGFGMLFGGLVASVMNPPWTMNVQWTALSISAFTYVVLIGTVVAFWCYLSSLKYVSAVIVGLMVCFGPLSAYLLSVFAFDLRIGLWEAAGICLVLLNVLVLSLPKKSTKAVKP